MGGWLAAWGASPALAHDAPEPVPDASGEQQTEQDPLPQYGSHARVARPRVETASTTRITARDMESVPLRNAEEALRLVPGFALVQHGSEGKGHQFFLRGFDAIHGADLELTVAGLPVNEWSNIHAQGYLDLGFVIPEALDSVEVTKGPFTLDQGAFAMAGSADYRLGVPEDRRGTRVGYTYGTTQRHRGVVTYSPGDGDGHDFVALEGLSDEGFGRNRGILRTALLGRVRLVDSPRAGTLSLLTSGYYAQFELPGTVRNDDVEAGRIGFYDAYDREGDGRSARGLLALHHTYRGERSTVQSTVYGGYRDLSLLESFTGFRIDPVNGDRRDQRQEGFQFGAKLVHDVHLHEKLMLRTGLGTRGDVFDQRQTHVGRQLEPLEVERDLSAIQTLTHALVGLRVRAPKVRVAVGARADVAHVAARDGLDEDRRDLGTPWALSPRAVVEWRPHWDWRLFASYGRGFRPPEARAFTAFEPEAVGLSEDLYTGGTPGMTQADATELGVRWIPSHHFATTLSGFGTWIESESIFDHVSGVNLELNGTRRLGAELEVIVDPVEWLRFVGDVTYVDARFVQSDNPVPLVPTVVGSARMVLTHPSGVRAGLRFFGLSPRPLPHGATGAAWTELDATVGYHWRWLRLDLELENLLFQRVREGEYHYASDWRSGEGPSELPVGHFVAGAPFNARLTLAVVF